MTEYRAYTVGRDGHFVDFKAMICDDDDEAIAQAKRLVDGHDIELWSGARLVIRLKAGKPGAVTHEIKDGRMIPKK